MGYGTFMFVVTVLQILYIIYVYIKSNRKIGYNNTDGNHYNSDYSDDDNYYNSDYSYSNNDNSYHQDDYNWISDPGFSHCDGNIYHIPND